MSSTYTSKRKNITPAAVDEWPGNNVPTFKNNSQASSKLDRLVQRLLPESLPEFNESTIRKHILDSLNERRRNIKKGYNYENVSSLHLKMDPAII